MTAAHIKNIIFDFGGVLFHIDFNLSHKAFSKLGLDTAHHFGFAQQSGLFDRLETGQLSEQEFYKELRQLFKAELTDEVIREAWNALLIGLPREHFELLQQLAQKYNLYLLSNTNIIHSTAFLRTIEEQLGEGVWSSVFKKTYYSHEIGMRKPGKEIFEWVLKDADIRAEETLFIDDSPKNLEVPAQMGMQVMPADRPVTELLKESELISWK